MPFIACSFCENTSKNCSKSILKLSKHLLDQLGAQKGCEIYSCTDHLLGGEDSVTQGARKRWRGDAKLEVPDESRQSRLFIMYEQPCTVRISFRAIVWHFGTVAEFEPKPETFNAERSKQYISTYFQNKTRDGCGVPGLITKISSPLPTFGPLDCPDVTLVFHINVSLL